MKSLLQTDFNTDDCNVIYQESSLCVSYFHQLSRDIMKTEVDIIVPARSSQVCK